MKKSKNLIEKVKIVTLENSSNIWVNSPFEFLRTTLTSDERGKWGENLAYELIKGLTDYEVIWDGDRNIKRKDGSIYDILVNDKRVEVKTATKGSKNDVWQHDNIYEENVWDIILFIDVNLYGIYFTIMNHSDIPFGTDKHKILNKQSTRHLSAWKFDLTINQIKTLEKHNISFYYDYNNPDEIEFKKFLTKLS